MAFTTGDRKCPSLYENKGKLNYKRIWKWVNIICDLKHELCKHNSDEVDYVLKLVSLLYVDLGECCGGMLHIVLDDGNLDDDDIQWCIDYCNKDENVGRNDKYLCLEIAHKMLKMNEYERRLVYYENGCVFGCNRECESCVIENEEEY